MPAIAHLESALAAQHAVLLAYSGGLDSSVLLHQLVLLRQRRPELQLRAVHVHHGLSPQADSWAAHCEQQCTQWQVPLRVARVQVDKAAGGIEAAARAARYAVFRQQLLPGEALLTAQHLDDQSETVLLALKRGSGPAGLAAMPQQHLLGSHHHLRPLLNSHRDDLEAWARQHDLCWIEDESNRDARYDRNFLRLEVLPRLNARWPHFASAVARSAALCAGQEQLLDELLAESLAQLMAADGSLAIRPLLAMSEARRNALLRRWIAHHQGLMPSRDALQRLWQEVACSREDAEPRLRLGQAEARRFRHRLYWLPLRDSLRERRLAWAAPWPALQLPQELGVLSLSESGALVVRAPQSDEAVSIRFQAQGAFQIVGRAGSRPLKKLWQEQAVPPWQRERTPLLFYNHCLIAALGVFVTREGAPLAGASCWHLNWQQENNRKSNDENIGSNRAAGL